MHVHDLPIQFELSANIWYFRDFVDKKFPNIQAIQTASCQHSTN